MANMIVKKRSFEGSLGATGVAKCNWSAHDDGLLSMAKYDKATLDDIFSFQLRLKMVSGACYIPKDNPLKPQGEDGHFICDEKQTIGVADGVGGWAKKGVDAGEYARGLMTNAVTAIHNEPKGAVNPRRVLNEAYSNTKAEGSSTACIVTLRDYYLQYVNVGDSGFMLFRDNKFLYQSQVQQRGFNCPYQLGNSEHSDRPSAAKEMMVAVIPGDIIVLGSDGLLDNMFPREIEQLLQQRNKYGAEPKQLACSIAQLALYNSFDKFALSPFAVAAQRAGRKHMQGGKIDDITVVVGYIV